MCLIVGVDEVLLDPSELLAIRLCTGAGSDCRLVALRTSPVGSLSGLSRSGPGWPWFGRCVCGRPACDLVTVGPDEGCAGRWQAEGRGRPDVEDDDLQRRGP